MTATIGRCGKPNGGCHRPNDPGHGPNLRVTYKVNGKTVTVSMPDQAAIRKVEREIAEFRKLQDLHKEFVEVNAQICRLILREIDWRKPVGVEPTCDTECRTLVLKTRPCTGKKWLPRAG